MKVVSEVFTQILTLTLCAPYQWRDRLYQLTQVSRAAFYRYLRGGWQAEKEVALRSVVEA